MLCIIVIAFGAENQKTNYNVIPSSHCVRRNRCILFSGHFTSAKRNSDYTDQ